MSETTALYNAYSKQEGIKLIDFGGWNMPLNFAAGIIKEHLMVRNSAGLFDVSHMGEFMIEGKDAVLFADYLLTNIVSGKQSGSCIYSPMCYENGGTVDDLLVYLISDDRLMLVVNAANRDKDADWIKKQLASFDGLSFTDISDRTSLLALQGPNAVHILKKLTDDEPDKLKTYTFMEHAMVAGIDCLVSRTGYTGEDGFELYLDNSGAVSLWKLFLHEFPVDELLSCGLGCRDTLRLEAALPLYGNELSADISPLEAGLKRFVKLDKTDFIGKKQLAEKEPGKKLYGCVMLDKGVPRHGNPVMLDGRQIGIVTSGSRAPSLDEFIALVLLDADSAGIDDRIIINCSGKDKQAKIAKLPFYRRSK